MKLIKFIHTALLFSCFLAASTISLHAEETSQDAAPEQQTCFSTQVIVLSLFRERPGITSKEMMDALDARMGAQSGECRQAQTCLSKPVIVQALQQNNPKITPDQISTALGVLEPLLERQSLYGCANLEPQDAAVAAAGGGDDTPEKAAARRLDYERAAKHGDAVAQYNLGLLSFKGQGVRQDFGRAYFWFALAAAGENKTFVAARDLAKGHLTPEQVTKVEGDIQDWKPYPKSDADKAK